MSDDEVTQQILQTMAADEAALKNSEEGQRRERERLSSALSDSERDREEQVPDTAGAAKVEEWFRGTLDFVPGAGHPLMANTTRTTADRALVGSSRTEFRPPRGEIAWNDKHKDAMWDLRLWAFQAARNMFPDSLYQEGGAGDYYRGDADRILQASVGFGLEALDEFLAGTLGMSENDLLLSEWAGEPEQNWYRRWTNPVLEAIGEVVVAPIRGAENLLNLLPGEDGGFAMGGERLTGTGEGKLQGTDFRGQFGYEAPHPGGTGISPFEQQMPGHDTRSWWWGEPGDSEIGDNLVPHTWQGLADMVAIGLVFPYLFPGANAAMGAALSRLNPVRALYNAGRLPNWLMLAMRERVAAVQAYQAKWGRLPEQRDFWNRYQAGEYFPEAGAFGVESSIPQGYAGIITPDNPTGRLTPTQVANMKPGEIFTADFPVGPAGVGQTERAFGQKPFADALPQGPVPAPFRPMSESGTGPIFGSTYNPTGRFMDVFEGRIGNIPTKQIPDDIAREIIHTPKLELNLETSLRDFWQNRWAELSYKERISVTEAAIARAYELNPNAVQLDERWFGEPIEIFSFWDDKPNIVDHVTQYGRDTARFFRGGAEEHSLRAHGFRNSLPRIWANWMTRWGGALLTNEEFQGILIAADQRNIDRWHMPPASNIFWGQEPSTTDFLNMTPEQRSKNMTPEQLSDYVQRHFPGHEDFVSQYVAPPEGPPGTPARESQGFPTALTPEEQAQDLWRLSPEDWTRISDRLSPAERGQVADAFRAIHGWLGGEAEMLSWYEIQRVAGFSQEEAATIAEGPPGTPAGPEAEPPPPRERPTISMHSPEEIRARQEAEARRLAGGVNYGNNLAKEMADQGMPVTPAEFQEALIEYYSDQFDMIHPMEGLEGPPGLGSPEVVVTEIGEGHPVLNKVDWMEARIDEFYEMHPTSTQTGGALSEFGDYPAEWDHVLSPEDRAARLEGHPDAEAIERRIRQLKEAYSETGEPFVAWRPEPDPSDYVTEREYSRAHNKWEEEMWPDSDPPDMPTGGESRGLNLTRDPALPDSSYETFGQEMLDDVFAIVRQHKDPTIPRQTGEDALELALRNQWDALSPEDQHSAYRFYLGEIGEQWRPYDVDNLSADEISEFITATVRWHQTGTHLTRENQDALYRRDWLDLAESERVHIEEWWRRMHPEQASGHETDPLDQIEDIANVMRWWNEGGGSGLASPTEGPPGTPGAPQAGELPEDVEGFLTPEQLEAIREDIMDQIFLDETGLHAEFLHMGLGELSERTYIEELMRLAMEAQAAGKEEITFLNKVWRADELEKTLYIRVLNTLSDAEHLEFQTHMIESAQSAARGGRMDYDMTGQELLAALYSLYPSKFPDFPDLEGGITMTMDDPPEGYENLPPEEVERVHQELIDSGILDTTPQQLFERIGGYEVRGRIGEGETIAGMSVPDEQGQRWLRIDPDRIVQVWRDGLASYESPAMDALLEMGVNLEEFQGLLRRGFRVDLLTNSEGFMEIVNSWRGGRPVSGRGLRLTGEYALMGFIWEHEMQHFMLRHGLDGRERGLREVPANEAALESLGLEPVIQREEYDYSMEAEARNEASFEESGELIDPRELGDPELEPEVTASPEGGDDLLEYAWRVHGETSPNIVRGDSQAPYSNELSQFYLPGPMRAFGEPNPVRIEPTGEETALYPTGQAEPRSAGIYGSGSISYAIDPNLPVITVHGGNNQNPVLSNFYEAPFEFEGHTFASAEGAYHAFKRGRYVRGFEHLGGAAAHARARRINVPTDQSITDDLMDRILAAKFQQVPEFAEELLATGLARIIHPVRDPHWGTDGDDAFAQALMNLRDFEMFRREHGYDPVAGEADLEDWLESYTRFVTSIDRHADPPEVSVRTPVEVEPLRPIRDVYRDMMATLTLRLDDVFGFPPMDQLIMIGYENEGELGLSGVVHSTQSGFAEWTDNIDLISVNPRGALDWLEWHRMGDATRQMSNEAQMFIEEIENMWLGTPVHRQGGDNGWLARRIENGIRSLDKIVAYVAEHPEVGIPQPPSPEERARQVGEMGTTPDSPGSEPGFDAHRNVPEGEDFPWDDLFRGRLGESDEPIMDPVSAANWDSAVVLPTGAETPAQWWSRLNGLEQRFVMNELDPFGQPASEGFASHGVGTGMRPEPTPGGGYFVGGERQTEPFWDPISMRGVSRSGRTGPPRGTPNSEGVDYNDVIMQEYRWLVRADSPTGAVVRGTFEAPYPEEIERYIRGGTDPDPVRIDDIPDTRSSFGERRQSSQGPGSQYLWSGNTFGSFGPSGAGNSVSDLHVAQILGNQSLASIEGDALAPIGQLAYHELAYRGYDVKSLGVEGTFSERDVFDLIGVDIDDIADIPRLVEESRTIAQGIADSATRGMAEAERWDMLESMSQHMQDPSTVGDAQIQDFYNRIGIAGSEPGPDAHRNYPVGDDPDVPYYSDPTDVYGGPLDPSMPGSELIGLEQARDLQVHTIISGGQVGADQAGWEVAADLGFETGGHMPSLFRTHFGDDPDVGALYGATEHISRRWEPRTRENVANSDATIIFTRNLPDEGVWFEGPGLLEPLPRRIYSMIAGNSRGSRLTIDMARGEAAARGVSPIEGGRPFIVVSGDSIEIRHTIREFLLAYNVEILNVAGPRGMSRTSSTDEVALEESQQYQQTIREFLNRVFTGE